MLRSIPLRLAAALLLLALGGCNFGKDGLADGLGPVDDAMAVPPLGQEIYRMFKTDKACAELAELPTQF